ncbi:amino acid ABC transporter membrane protein 1 (PAAT family) [Breoghania corrubedonensis]|uniref:Amino acid ABC transporter membrane protein 1 (PAAT family) n=1 Tax=Breoghania corrubedonensis TaxID=665038 RepID=A0A2T5VFR0_9HYPH|nr:amino acid ABC transporter permease [Breoghania corrubedonensis]PTW62578.1 amino acid ABC transporter membrane protein 1 (PAAT family) [Breoghania corrubedonensis]
MHYTLHFGQVTPEIPYLLWGALISLELSVMAFAGGMVIGMVGAIMRLRGGRWLSRLARWYVTFFTNTPQLVQIYFIFFALPEVGILLDPFPAVLLGMTLNAGGYLTEILRAGLASVHQQELDAAETLGMSHLQTLRYVILPHIFKVVMPAMTNQYILMTLGTSMAAIFGVEELTGRAFNINSTTFRSIEIFLLTGGIYVLVTLAATSLLALVGRYAFRARVRIL